jgi:ubiquinone biosynthesis protein
MTKLPKIFRLIKIHNVFMRYVFNRSVLDSATPWLRRLSYANPWSYLSHGKNRSDSINHAFVSLGPLFVKFGQMLSTRPDLFPEDIVHCLEKLQDRVPAFDGEIATSMIEKNYRKPINELFLKFDKKPLASASIAQVHAATLHDDSDVVVKILRPNIATIIKQDISLLHTIARIVEYCWHHGKRLHPIALVKEYEQTITDEQDLMREAASASQLRRNFEHSTMMYVPKVYWDYASHDALVFERIYGTQITDIATLKKKQVNLKRLAEYGVEIFFTQVFKHSFFHADMHPGNLFVDTTDPNYPKYIGVDFGIMGALSPEDQHYIAANLLAFFQRDYRKVALLHIESNWVPADTRIDQFEAAIRTVCEPIFEKPLKDISFGELLIGLFRTAERFHMEVQPQLMLLQKTLLSIEGLGRQLYPDLDLWNTAQPFLENWIKERYGIKTLTKHFIEQLPDTAKKIIETPSTLFEVLRHLEKKQRQTMPTSPPIEKNKKPNRSKSFLLGAGSATLGIGLFLFLHRHGVATTTELWLLTSGAIIIFASWLLSHSD